MIDSIDRYYRYRSFDGSIKIKIVFKKEVGCFFVAMGKNAENYANFFLQFDRLIETIDSVCTDGSMAIGQRSLL
jgi:hypothetical protein